MKKIIFLFILGFMIFTRAEASSIIFNPNSINAQAGKTFSLPVLIDGTGAGNYTVRIFLKFPTDLLEITSFTFSSNWITLSQPGYDEINNNSGQLIKTAGFPGGFSGRVPFGTINFRVKNAGEGVLTVENQSFILDAVNTSTLASRPQVRVLVTEGAVLETPPSEPLPSLPTGEQNLFDILISPQQGLKGISAISIIILILLAVVLGTILRIIFVKLHRKSFIEKLKHDQDNKN